MAEYDEAKWYVVHTYSGYENKVMTDLEKMVENRGMQDLIQDIRIPTETVTEITADGKEKQVEWYVVRNTRGCTGFVGPASKPVPLTDKEVEAIGVEKRTVEVAYSVGDTVNIIDGPLEGFTGVVDEIDVDNNNVRVTISMFGRETPVELELTQIELIKD